MLNGQGHIGIGPIDAGSVREMILRPAQCAGLSLSEKLVRRVTDEAGHELGNLPLLAFALWQLFDKRAGKELTERAYDEMGGLAGAISQRADRVMTELGEEARNAFDKVFAQLVHLERERPPTRRRVSLMVFRSDAPANQLIETLAGPKCRILVKGGEGSEAMVEVAHEKLFSAWPKLKDWIDSSSADLRLIDYVEEAARRWYETGCHLEEVWRKERAEAVERALTRFKRMPSAQLYTMIHPQKMLIERLDDAALSHEDRLLIGQKLCEFGDTRDGVGLKDGLPDIVWIDIPGGSIILEEIDQVFEVKTFRIAKYPVTNLQFEAFISAQDGYRNKQWWNNIEPSEKARVTTWKETNAPRETVSWYEAVAFCRWLSAKTGKSIHLPTEWEWQQAATGGDPQRKYPWEGGWDGFRCNSWDSRLSRTTAVGIYPAGATTQGIYDMAGNVWEWCQNKYENPEGPEAVRIDKGGERVLRGGSWDSRPEYLLASYRDDRDDVVARGGGLGFRLVQDIP